MVGSHFHILEPSLWGGQILYLPKSLLRIRSTGRQASFKQSNHWGQTVESLCLAEQLGMNIWISIFLFLNSNIIHHAIFVYLVSPFFCLAAPHKSKVWRGGGQGSQSELRASDFHIKNMHDRWHHIEPRVEKHVEAKCFTLFLVEWVCWDFKHNFLVQFWKPNLNFRDLQMKPAGCF